ncbi:hypothetical protein AB0J80_36350 [Actinoplanes sp. NPDC049548]|uniref:hypothetical protein n=1 Tax=Actinoplanes sp. NPDC049548 TaxID=3155152 RepID=UPI003434401B
MRTQRCTVLVGVLAAGLLLTQQACTATGRKVSRPVAFTAPASLLTGERRVTIQPVPGAAVSIGGSDRFILTPTGDKYLIKTSSASCLLAGARTVTTSPCDPARAGQLFTITPQGPSTYAISNQGAYLQVTSGGELVVEGPLKTTFTLIDEGPARG